MEQMQLKDAEYFLQNISQCVNETEKGLDDLLHIRLMNQLYVLSWQMKLIWTFLFGVTTSVSMVENAIIIWFIIFNKLMRTRPNMFTLNLAISDFLMASVNAALNLIPLMKGDWPFGYFICVTRNFLANLAITTSTFTVFTLNMDRFVATVRPLRRRMSMSRVAGITGSMWLAGTILCCPWLIYSRCITAKFPNSSYRTFCFMEWPDGPAGSSYYDHMYNIIFLIMTFIAPMGCMIISSTRICYTLFKNKVVGEKTIFENDVVRSRRKVGCMLIATAVLFGVCWLPYHLFFLYIGCHQEVIVYDYIPHIYLAICWLTTCSPCFNTIINYWTNIRFRNYFKRVLCISKPSERPHSVILPMSDMPQPLPRYLFRHV